MPRSTNEWIGKTDDSPVPARVRVRIFDRSGGVCHISGRKIRPGEAWDLDHIIALINGGTHTELNLSPVLIDPHREKTKEDVAEKSRVARKRKSHLGIKKPSRFPGSRNSQWKKKMDGTVARRDHD
jgi:5-methylcytosine-specific restriction protein A